MTNPSREHQKPRFEFPRGLRPVMPNSASWSSQSLNPLIRDALPGNRVPDVDDAIRHTRQ
jgi:hypothetical protein